MLKCVEKAFYYYFFYFMAVIMVINYRSIHFRFNQVVKIKVKCALRQAPIYRAISSNRYMHESCIGSKTNQQNICEEEEEPTTLPLPLIYLPLLSIARNFHIAHYHFFRIYLAKKTQLLSHTHTALNVLLLSIQPECLVE